jgi:hypothetical protein
MGKKAETIRRALNHKGIPLTEGIPEQIIQELRDAGYVIKKNRVKKNK